MGSLQFSSGIRLRRRYAGRYGERGDLRRGGRHRQSGGGGVGTARHPLPRGGPFAAEVGPGVRQDGERGGLSGRFERGARGGGGGARGGNHPLLCRPALSFAETHYFFVRLLEAVLGNEEAWGDIAAHLTRTYGPAMQQGLGLSDDELAGFV